MDFVEGLPKSQLKSVVFVVVDRLTKYVHFIPLSHLYTAAKGAHLFMQLVFKLHDLNLAWIGFLWVTFGLTLTSLKLTPFEALYGYPPPKVMDYVPGITRVAAVDSFLKDRQQLLSLLKHNLTTTQERMKWFANKKRVDRSFAVGDWVLQKVREVSYMLDLPVGSLIHPVFYVSNLKAKLGTHVVPRPTLPAVTVDQILSPELVAILATRSHQLNRVP
ncbi:uncharacterized protein LOC142635791 [Castanea sativa]|uniref:uncharacterized protein LOC142635791 n=1 Tax=Castanea sativa TaxID=21020 RepID=UPI003F6517F2